MNNIQIDLKYIFSSYDYLVYVKYNYWSIINAAFWLVELLLGYMLYPTSSEKRGLFGGKKGLKSSFN